PRKRELAQLGLHRALGHDLVVDVELHPTEVLLELARGFADELHPEDVFTWLKFLGGDKVLFRFDAEEVVNVVQLLVLEEERVPPKARAMREDHADGVRVGDFDVGQDLERAPADADGYAFRHWRRVWVVEVTFANRLIAGTLDREELRCRPIIQRQDE